MTDPIRDYTIEPARAEHLADLPAIEVAACAVFPVEDLAFELREAGLPVSFFEQAAREGSLWTAVEDATQQPVGFAVARVVDDHAHLYEMDVLPAHARRGLGAAFVGVVAAWARTQQLSCVTLTTFRHLKWNAPFYERLGFRALAQAELSPALAEMLRKEAEHGLDPDKRVAMRLEL